MAEAPKEVKRGRPTLDSANQDLLTKLQQFWDQSESVYAKEFKKIRMLDMADRGEFWKTVNAVFPKYQILPDTNYVAYIKGNLLASIYSVVKSAEIIPTCPEDKDICTKLNLILDAVWNTSKVGQYQFQAGERAALCNFGLTQVGWDEGATRGSGKNIVKGNLKFKNIDPLKFKRDPYATELETAGWCCTYEHLHKSVFEADSRYSKAFKEYLLKHKEGNTTPIFSDGPDNITKSGAKDYYTLICWWVREGANINEYHTVNNEYLLYKKEEIQPSAFPFAPLFCNLPSGALIGTSEPAKIFANNVVQNLMDSLAFTAEYKNQHPPKFISADSKLNTQAFAKHGDDAEKTFVVAGEASRAVHYQIFPTMSPLTINLKEQLERNIKNISGVDDRYTGRDTGSIITTGGTENMLNRVTLIDTPHIIMYEAYCKTLTELVLKNLIKYCPKRSFYRKKPNSTQYEVYDIDFPSISDDILFDYRLEVSSELPKNKQRVAAAATALLEKQAQYNQNGGSTVQWITEEEWLMFQDLPMKEYLLERMGIQRLENAEAETAQVLYQYAQMIKSGAQPDEALAATAETLSRTRRGENPELPAGPNPQLQQMVNEGPVE